MLGRTRPFWLWPVVTVMVALALTFGFYFAVNAVARAVTYHPTREAVLPVMPGVSAVTIRTEDGEALQAWYAPAQHGAPTILFFDGNAGRLSANAARFSAVMQEGAGMLAVAYRGYSGSTGTPSEAGLNEDARAGYDWLRANGVHAQAIVIHGFSLGSAVAVRLASERPAGALILEAPMTSIADVAQAGAPGFVPVGLVLQDKFLSREYISRVNMPVLIIHGDADETIPFAMSERMFELARMPKTFVRVRGGGHNDLVSRGLYAHAFNFLRDLR